MTTTFTAEPILTSASSKPETNCAKLPYPNSGWVRQPTSMYKFISEPQEYTINAQQTIGIASGT